MARLTIEDCWWTDPRRERLGALLNSVESADAAAIRMWRLAQEFWGRGRKPVPKEIFDTLQAAPKLIEAGLARVEEGGVYVKGSSQYIEWLNEKREAGKAGGKKSSQRPRNAKGQLTKTPKQNPSTTPSKPKHDQPSGFGSGSGSGSVIQLPTGAGALSANAITPVGLWMAAYKRKYEVTYPLQKQDAGMLTNFARVRKAEEVARLFACYLAIESPFYLREKHPLKFFFSDLAKISHAAQTGVDPSKPPPLDLSKLKD